MTKKDLLLDLLQRAWPYLQIDGRVEGVDLPDWLRGPNVTLQIGYDMPVAIPDLKVDDWGVTATLSFKRTPHTCRIPWKAVYAIADSDGRGLLFPEDVPPEVARAEGSESAAPAEASPEATPPPPPEAPPEKPPTFKNGRPRPSHLKLV